MNHQEKYRSNAVVFLEALQSGKGVRIDGESFQLIDDSIVINGVGCDAETWPFEQFLIRSRRASTAERIYAIALIGKERIPTGEPIFVLANLVGRLSGWQDGGEFIVYAQAHEIAGFPLLRFEDQAQLLALEYLSGAWAHKAGLDKQLEPVWIDRWNISFAKWLAEKNGKATQ